MKNRIYITLLVFFVTQIALKAQNLTAGSGFKDIYIGISSDNAEKLLGKPEQIDDYESEKMDWLKSEIDIEKELVFRIGFDNVYSYRENKYSIWKIFYKNNKAVFFILSSYLISDSLIESVSVNNTLFFNDSISKALQMFGNKAFIIPDEENSDYYLFPEYGISIYTEDELVKVFYIYQAFKGEELNAIKKLFE